MDTPHHSPAMLRAPAAGGDRRVREALAHALDTRAPWILCVVAATEGSTYRKAGALVLVVPDRPNVGSLSGGCLEQDLALHGARALASGRPCVEVYDSTGDDDLVYGSGSGCRGRTHVLLLPSTADGAGEVARLLLEAARQRSTLQFTLRADGGAAAGECHGQGRRASFGGGASTGIRFEIRAPARVVLVGAGPEAAPLARACLAMGWQVELVDHREARIAAHAGDVDRVHAGRPRAGLAAAAPAAVDAIVIMSHSAGIDGEALAVAAEGAAGYVGLLGPPARRDELLAALAPDARARLAGRLHAPVGLRLGGHGPEALALSIVAGLQAYFTGAPGPVPG